MMAGPASVKGQLPLGVWVTGLLLLYLGDSVRIMPCSNISHLCRVSPSVCCFSLLSFVGHFFSSSLLLSHLPFPLLLPPSGWNLTHHSTAFSGHHQPPLASARSLLSHHLYFYTVGYFGFLKPLLASLTPHSAAPTPPSQAFPPTLLCWVPLPCSGSECWTTPGPKSRSLFLLYLHALLR